VTGDQPRPTTVLVLCTGNVCRSPAGELLLRARLRGARVEVASAGTRALVGAPVDGPMAGELRAVGVDPSAFAARALLAAHLRSADLVLAMAREHRAAAAALVPAAVRRTLLLTEAADLGAAVAAEGWPDDVAPDPAARLAALPRLAPRHRRPGGGADPDVADPYRRDAAASRAAFLRIRDAVDRLADAVTPIRPAGPGHPTGSSRA
jgi:protein-tyrosine phosphatase